MKRSVRVVVALAACALAMHVALLAVLDFGRFDASDYLTPKGRR